MAATRRRQRLDLLDHPEGQPSPGDNVSIFPAARGGSRAYDHRVLTSAPRQALPATAQSGTPLIGPAGQDPPIAAGHKDADGFRPGGMLLTDCRVRLPQFDRLVSRAALANAVDDRALAVRSLLHLPRLAGPGGWLAYGQVEREVRKNARRLRLDADAAAALIPAGTFTLSQLAYAEDVDEKVSGRLFSTLHYLRNARPGSRSFALLDPETSLPVTICSIAPLEWKRVGNYIDENFGVPLERIWDVSRVYSCDAAPRNAISYLLAKVRGSAARSDSKVELLVTAVDPNLGFTGSSYRAANWQQWLAVRYRPYLYCDSWYASPRQLRQRFGTSSRAELQARFPQHRFEQSRVQLLDSLIFCCRVSRETEPAPAGSLRPLHR
ncbi:MAG: hypothetical protein ACLP7J_02640 [Streptosporangiaceae bacterium]